MVTIGIIGIWFLISSLIFMIFCFLLEEEMDIHRSFNTFVVLLSQGLGALISYALS